MPALAVFAVEQVADGFAARFVGFRLGLALFGGQGMASGGFRGFRLAALGQRLAKPGLPGRSSNSSPQTTQVLIGNAIYSYGNPAAAEFSSVRPGAANWPDLHKSLRPSTALF